ncbi:hypothetical protein MBVR141_0889 [Mycoplasmopsis bovirhinis]|uniref:hypothetical protein n=1 Tax=Mycoplasmopsis bovirhinis TaxID=29553 RepID=UPI000BB9E638|nr:hypothetical protein [Mycoplasmopsis bovirhinis]BBA22568.1 hypothetical protein MBVR141_0889 [Mycoplasmopsis bovirhinis]
MTKKQWILLGGGLTFGGAVVATAAIIAVTSKGKANEVTPADNFKKNNQTVLTKTVANITINDKATLQSALSAYAQLTPQEQAKLVNEKVKMDQLNLQIQDLEKIAKFKSDNSAALAKTKTTVAISDKAAVDAALTNYSQVVGTIIDGITKLQSEKTLLDDLRKQINDLESAKALNDHNTSEADKFKQDNANILAKSKASVQVSDKSDVEYALNWYDKFDQAIKNLLSSEKSLLDELKVKIQNLEQENKFNADHSVALNFTVEDLTLQDKTLVEAANSAFNELSNESKTKLASTKTLLDDLVAQLPKLETLKSQLQTIIDTRVLIQEEKTKFTTLVNNEKTLKEYNNLKDSTFEEYFKKVHEEIKAKISTELGDNQDAKDLIAKADEIFKKENWTDQEMKALEEQIKTAKANNAQYQLIFSTFTKEPTVDQENNSIVFYLKYDQNKLNEFASKFVKVKVVLNQGGEEYIQETTRPIQNPIWQGNDLVEKLAIRTGKKVTLGNYKNPQYTEQGAAKGENGTDKNSSDDSTNATNTNFTATIYFKDENDNEYKYAVIIYKADPAKNKQASSNSSS